MPRPANAPLPQPLFAEPVFSEGVPTPDPTTFKITPTDNGLYNGIEDLLKKDVVGFEPSRLTAHDLFELQAAWGSHGAEVLQQIQKAGQIVFHAVGDSGASASRNLPGELKVSDLLTDDLNSSKPDDRPSFLYHLGDLVYNFGESPYYYDQFYEPFRDYGAPVFAIPGNHDSFIVPNTPAGQEPLTIFTRNFCATTPVVTQEAGSLHRTAMTQPGVYFTLDAPFVRIIGLFSNSLEDPGVISSENGKWTAVPDLQLDFLTAQLSRIKTEKYAGAVILAVHHPPFSYSAKPVKQAPVGASGNHFGNSVMLGQIDTICKAQGVYPHAFLSAHAHNYQRYTRKVGFNGKNFTVPFVVCGDGGHNVNPLVRPSKGQPMPQIGDDIDVSYLDVSPAVKAGGLTLNKHDQSNYGYLRVTVDANQLAIEFHPVNPKAAGALPVDSVKVNLANHTITK
jgi:calcineurin-like phosphoesterase family protein